MERPSVLTDFEPSRASGWHLQTKKLNMRTTLDFLTKLSTNNNREWFNENKNLYTEAQGKVLKFVEHLIAEIAKFDEEISKIDAKKSLFRIYRDTRFSKDKSPYKTNFGSAFGIGKGHKKGGYYLHIEPGKSFLAGGVYQPEPAVLKEIRKEISTFGDDFLKVVEAKDFKKYFGELDQGAKLVKVPQGFEKDDKMAEFLKLKNFIVMYPLKDGDLMDEFAAKNFAKIYKAMKPLNDFLNAPFQ